MTDNDQFVGVRGDKIVVLAPKQSMARAQALRHAAWIVALADEDEEFPAVLEAVRRS